MHKISFVSLVVLCACGQITTATSGEALNEDSPLQQFARYPFDESPNDSLALLNTRSEIIERFGTPLEEQVTPRPDGEGLEIRTHYFLQYDGFSFDIIESEDKKHSGIERVQITGNARALKFGLRIGSKRSDVESLFQPDEAWLGSRHVRIKAKVTEKRNDGVTLFSLITVVIDFDEADTVTKLALWSYEE